MIYMRKSRTDGRFQGLNPQISVYFPAEQGMGVRDGFADVCLTAIIFNVFSFLADPNTYCNVSLKSRKHGFANVSRTDYAPSVCFEG